MDVTSEYFSQKLNKNSSNKLSTKRKPEKSKTSKNSNSNESKRRSSTFFKDFFQVDSSIKESCSKENVGKFAASSSSETNGEPSQDSFALQSPVENTEADSHGNIYFDDTLIITKPDPVKPPKTSGNIYLDETILSSHESYSVVPSSKKEQLKRNEVAPKRELTEDVRWKQLDNLKRCPVCLKKYDKLVSHVKSCASKQNITTEQLFKAIELQLKQNDERAALGFLSSQVVKAPSTSRTARTASTSKGAKDASLELALALSISLQESKMSSIIKESDALMEMGLEAEALEQRKALEQFALPEPATRIAPKSSKSFPAEKKKLQSKLFYRSKEDRERILAEKVANILMEGDCSLDSDPDSQKTVNSRIHTKFPNKSKNLWRLSKEEVKSNDQFYVSRLSDSIVPNREDIYARLKSKAPIQEFDSPVQSDAYLKEIFKPDFSSNCHSTSTNSKLSITTPNPVINSQAKNAKITSCSCNVIPSKKQSKSASLLKDLSTNWSHLLNNKMYSDLKIISKEEKEISAHRVVFFARCPNVLDDLIMETDPRTNSQSCMLAWNDFSAAAIFLFLEFLYCARVDFSKLDESIKSELFNLSERYDANFLVNYVEDVESCAEQSFILGDNAAFSTTESPNPCIKLASSNHVETPKYSKLPDYNCPESQNRSENFGTSMKQVNSPSQNSNDTVELGDKLDRSLSPDMFGSDAAPLENSSFMENHPENLIKLVELIQESKEQEYSDKITDAFVDSSGENSNGGPDTELEIEYISSADDVPLEVKSSGCKNLLNQTEVVEIISSGEDESRNSEFVGISLSYENTDSTYYDDKENSAPKEANEGSQSSQRSFSRKRKSSVSPANSDKSKKACLVDDMKVLSVDLTQESSDTNSSKTLQPDVSDSESPLNLNLSDEQDCDNLDVVNCSSSTIVLPENEKTLCGNLERQSLSGSPTSPARDLPQDGGAEEENNYGYISPFWEAFDEGCGDFAVASGSPIRSESPTDANSPLRQESSPKVSSPGKVISSGSIPSNESSQDVISLSPESVSPKPNKSFSPAQVTERVSVSPLSSPVWSSEKLTSPLKSAFQVLNSTSPRRQRRPGSENFANDSLFENESLLNQIELNAQRPPATTNSQQQIERDDEIRTPSPQVQHDSNVTPLLDYSSMKTVQIKNELIKYGLKPSLGKKKGKLLLRYIYNELHPTVDSTSPEKHCDTIDKNAKNQTAASSKNHVSETDSENDENNEEDQFECSFSSSTSTLPEESFSQEPLENLTQTSKSKYLKGDELEKRILEFIRSDRNLYKKVLMYEPLWLEKFQEDLKNNGIKCKSSDLMDILDKKCVTFRTLASMNRNTKRSERSKKVKLALSQPIKSPKKRGRRGKITEKVTYDSD